MKIVFLEVKETWEKNMIKDAFPEAEMVKHGVDSCSDELLKKVEILSSFIYSKLDAETLRKMPELKCIATRSTGYDHVDLDYCRKNNIAVYNVPHYGENTVAEFTFGLLLTISRKIIESVRRVQSGSFDFIGLRGFDIAGKTVGIVGFGNIGKRFANMCLGFEMKVLVSDPFLKKAEAKKFGVELVDFDDLLARSDVISLHVPLTPKTKHIVNKQTIAKMKKGVILLNTARGDLIDSTALLDGLYKKKVAFAGLDVLEGEQMIKDELELLREDSKKKYDMQILLEDHMLMNHSRVYVTPHNAFNTQDALERIVKTSLENINFFLKKKKDNRVD